MVTEMAVAGLWFLMVWWPFQADQPAYGAQAFAHYQSETACRMNLSKVVHLVIKARPKKSVRELPGEALVGCRFMPDQPSV